MINLREFRFPPVFCLHVDGVNMFPRPGGETAANHTRPVVAERFPVRGLGVHVAPLGKLYVPDLVVMPTELIAAADPEVSDPMDASEALLVVEITSRGNAREDRTKKYRTKKYRAYARAGVPMYLLIDRFDPRGPMATLFTEPNEGGTYKHTDAVPFGKPLALPSPFDAQLMTGEFPGPAV